MDRCRDGQTDRYAFYYAAYGSSSLLHVVYLTFQIFYSIQFFFPVQSHSHVFWYICSSFFPSSLPSSLISFRPLSFFLISFLPRYFPLSLCLSLSLSVYLSISQFFCLCLSLSSSLSLSVSLSLCVSLSLSLSISISLSLSSINQSLHTALSWATHTVSRGELAEGAFRLGVVVVVM